ncbi:MAG: MBL fold metallo-hydrolase [Thermoplasmata archaeon]
MRSMDVEFLCSDSMGVRSMSIFIDLGIKMIIDPSASLGPYRYGLRPTKIEYDKLIECKNKIRMKAKMSDIMIITHYHYDHYDPDEDFYVGKKLIIKDPKNDINRSQKIRAEYFLSKIGNYLIADSNEYHFWDTRIKFTRPFHHGNEKSRLGYVVAVIVEKNKKIVFTSDVEGPVVEEVKDFIIKENPDIAIIDGPPTYFLGYKFSQNDLEKARENLKAISKEIDKIVLDHHLLRDLKYREILKDVYVNGNILTYAEMNGEEINTLEAHRKELYREGYDEVNLDFKE